jgi:hypothetical protein
LSFGSDVLVGVGDVCVWLGLEKCSKLVVFGVESKSGSEVEVEVAVNVDSGVEVVGPNVVIPGASLAVFEAGLSSFVVVVDVGWVFVVVFLGNVVAVIVA